MRPIGEVESGVLVGHEGQLFLADGGHDVLNFVLRKRTVDPQSIENFCTNTQARRDYAMARSIRYCHVIFPDKQSILTRHFPFADPACLGETYLAAAPWLRETVIYPRETLRAAGTSVFQRTDTHLSDLGTILVTAEVAAKVIAPDADAQILRLATELTHEVDWVGDLGSRFSPPMAEKRSVYQGSTRSFWFNNELNGGNNGLVDYMINPDAVHKLRVLVMGDSFGRELKRFLSVIVSEAMFLRTPFFHPEMCDQIAPDVLITDNVERYFSWCSADADRPPFLMYPYMSGRGYTQSPEFTEAFTAMLSYPRKPYLEFMASLQEKHRSAHRP